MATQLIDRLASLSSLSGIPRKELKWLAENGRFVVYEVGTVIGEKGKPVDDLWIIFSGKVTIRVDRGVGPRLVTEWGVGDVTGMLPYSRMKGPPGDNYIEEKAELLAIDVKLFPKMITQCPAFTTFTVHSMLDRTRNFNTSDLQDEKMISLGKLSAGLAHELNNPASATVRNAKLLVGDLNHMDEASRALGAAGLTNVQLTGIMNMRTECFSNAEDLLLSSIQKADHQDKINDWLICRKLDPAIAIPLSDTCITINQLEKLANAIPSDVLDVTLKWIAATCTTQALAKEIEHASIQVYKVVDAVKKFTYMDNLTGKELVDIESGIRDTMNVLVAKTKTKCACITLKIDENLSKVYANGSDLNQVWFSLLDNAIDAISESGNIRIEACSERERVMVRIVDDGPGIAPDNINKIFDPFFTSKPQGQGTGLGLEIARRLLRRYHGDISVNSQPGRTEFRVSLLSATPKKPTVNHNIETSAE